MVSSGKIITGKRPIEIIIWAVTMAAGLAIVMAIFSTQVFSTGITVTSSALSGGTLVSPSITQFDVTAVTNEGLLSYKKVTTLITSGTITTVTPESGVEATVAGATQVELINSVGTLISVGCVTINVLDKKAIITMAPSVAAVDVVRQKILSLVSC